MSAARRAWLALGICLGVLLGSKPARALNPDVVPILAVYAEVETGDAAPARKALRSALPLEAVVVDASEFATALSETGQTKPLRKDLARPETKELLFKRLRDAAAKLHANRVVYGVFGGAKPNRKVRLIVLDVRGDPPLIDTVLPLQRAEDDTDVLWTAVKPVLRPSPVPDAEPPPPAPPTPSPSGRPGPNPAPDVARHPEPSTPAPPVSPAVSPTAKAPPPKGGLLYSLPWQLRPILSATVMRSDTSVAAFENSAGTGGLTVVTAIGIAYKVPGTGKPGVGLTAFGRLAAVNDSPPVGDGGFAVMNPVLGGFWAFKLAPPIWFAPFMGFSIPIGMGGGDSPDPDLVGARGRGSLARSNYEGALYAVNDLTVLLGASLGYVAKGWTLQTEATYAELTRVRGDAAQLEAKKRAITAGIHVGYYLVKELSLGIDLRNQTWLNAPFVVERSPTSRLNTVFTVAVGPRFHFKLSPTISVNPGLSYTRGIDKQLAGATPNYHIGQLDIAFVFL